MEPTPNFSEQLDAYLLGNLPDEQASALAAKAEQDPLLAQELHLQQDVVAGLRRARAAQLKARLNQIPTPPASGLSAGQWIGLGTAASVLVAGGLALYLSQKPDQAQFKADSTRQASESYTPLQEPAPAQPAITSDATLPTPTGEASTGESIEPPALIEAKTEPAGLPRVSKPQSGKPLTYVVPKAKTAADPTAIGLAMPDEEADEPGLIDRPGINTMPTGKVVENNDVQSKPEVVIKESDVLAYQYFDNRLFLYGSFGDAIYEVIELVSAKEGRRLFVFYKDRFYNVNSNVRDVTPMSEVTDQKLVGELTLLRKKRID